MSTCGQCRYFAGVGLYGTCLHPAGKGEKVCREDGGCWLFERVSLARGRIAG